MAHFHAQSQYTDHDEPVDPIDPVERIENVDPVETVECGCHTMLGPVAHIYGPIVRVAELDQCQKRRCPYVSILT